MFGNTRQSPYETRIIADFIAAAGRRSTGLSFSRCRNMFHNNGVLFSYGAHWPLAAYVTAPSGKSAILLNVSRHGSSKTAAQVNDVARAVERADYAPAFSVPGRTFDALTPTASKNYLTLDPCAVQAAADYAAHFQARTTEHRIAHGNITSVLPSENTRPTWHQLKAAALHTSPDHQPLAEFFGLAVSPAATARLENARRALALMHNFYIYNYAETPESAAENVRTALIAKIHNALKTRAKTETREAVYCLAGYAPIIFGGNNRYIAAEYETRRTYHGSEATAQKYIDAANHFRDRFRPKAAPLSGFDTIAKPIRAALALKKLTGQWDDAA
jgi:hypothetical protein